MSLPINHRKRWDESDRRLLVDMLADNKSVKTIAFHLRRSIGAIESRIRILKSFEDACGVCIIEQEVLNTKSIIDIGRILAAEANKVAFKGGELNITDVVDVTKLKLEYKLLVSESGEIYVEFKGLIPVDAHNPRVKEVTIKQLQ